MHSHLIVMTFEQEDEAQRVYNALQRMRGSSLLGLENAAALTKDRDGTFAVTRKRALSPAGVGSGDDLFRSIMALLFGDPPDEVLQALVREGFDERFREHVVQAMVSNCSAFVILLPRDSQVDRGRLLGILTLFEGQVLETTLPRPVEAILAQGWEA
jgi:uncharacterized membrane protein